MLQAPGSEGEDGEVLRRQVHVHGQEFDGPGAVSEALISRLGGGCAVQLHSHPRPEAPGTHAKANRESFVQNGALGFGVMRVDADCDGGEDLDAPLESGEDF